MNETNNDNIIDLMNQNHKLRKALERARCYVVVAVKEDGGIDNCDISYRMDLQAIDAALNN